MGRGDITSTETYGTSRANAYKILEDTLNLKDVRIYDAIEDEEGRPKRVLNKTDTMLAQQKQQVIKDAFANWIWQDPQRRIALVKQYNELFNSNRPREYDGSHIHFVGMNPEISLREHQRNAIAHVLYGGNTLLAHEVGAGKTFEINHNLVYRVQEDGTCTNHVNSPKTKAGIRIIPMIDEVFDAFLEEYQYQKVIGFCTDEIDGYSGFVFCTGDGKVYLPNAINRTIRSICADYNKEEESKAKEENRDPILLPKFSCHILRHTFCTRFCENETNLKVIQEIMGHADISTTMDVYAEATQEKKKESMTSLQSALLVR